MSLHKTGIEVQGCHVWIEVPETKEGKMDQAADLRARNCERALKIPYEKLAKKFAGEIERWKAKQRNDQQGRGAAP